MTMRKFAPPILEAWATWEMLRKLGFKADDIFWQFQNTLNAVPKPGMTLSIWLKTQGKELSIVCSRSMTDAEARRMEADARVFMETLNKDEFDQKEMDEILHASFAWKNQADFLMALLRKGFELPYKRMRETN